MANDGSGPKTQARTAFLTVLDGYTLQDLAVPRDSLRALLQITRPLPTPPVVLG